MKLAPIVIFTYNRPWHTQQTVEALLKNEYASESDLIIFSDAPKNEAAKKGVEESRSYIRNITGFKSLRIIERDRNFGLANNIIDGVTSIVNEFGRIIVLEDDLLTSPYFLKFMNEALDKYEKVEEVVSVHGYLYPVKEKLPTNFFLKHTDSLGWGTWKESWNVFNSDGAYLLSKLESRKIVGEFNFNDTYNFAKMLKDQIEGLNNSWAIRWYASTFLADKISLFPNVSLVYHNGNDLQATNSSIGDDWLDVELSDHPIPLVEIPLKENKDVRLVYERFFRTVFSFRGKIKRKIKELYGKITQMYK